MKRGLITPNTTRNDFIEKVKEEVEELENHTDMVNYHEELTDIIVTCLNALEHENVDIQLQLRKVRNKNNSRAYEKQKRRI